MLSLCFAGFYLCNVMVVQVLAMGHVLLCVCVTHTSFVSEWLNVGDANSATQ